MPTVFISYSSAQQAVAQQLEAELTAKGVKVWRDKTSLHAGERWPKALGDAIADSDSLVLLWSADASQSDFVELEWNIAVAMKKPVMPCLLDDISLPPTLKPSHGIPGKEISQAAEQIMAKLKGLSSSSSIVQQEKLLEILDAVSATEPRQVLQHLTTIINQPNWAVQGNVTQAGRDVVYNIFPNAETPKDDAGKGASELESQWKPIHTWIATLGVLMGIIVGGFQVFDYLKDRSPGPAKSPISTGKIEDGTSNQSVAGIITDNQEHPLADVKVVLTSIEDAQLEKENFTSKNGRFTFSVKGKEGQAIKIMATKPCFETITKSGYLGHTTLDFSMPHEFKEDASCPQ